MRHDEFRTRYIVKLVSSVLIAIINIIIQLILPRALSVDDYGFYTFNLNVFTSIVTMATLSVPSAMVSKFSKRNNEIGHIYFYIFFSIAIIMLLNIVIIGIVFSKWYDKIFSGQVLTTVILGLETSIVLRVFTDNIGIFDAMAIARYPAVVQIVSKIVIFISVICIYFFNELTLTSFYSIQIITIGLLSVLMVYSAIKEIKKGNVIVNRGLYHYAKEYFEFCKPLVLYNIFSQFVIIFMNWVLLKNGGAVEQAMFGAAWQLNTLVSYVFSPYAELSKREFAVNVKNNHQLKILYEKSLRLMMWLTSYFAIYIALGSKWLLPIVFGNKYEGATIVTILIMYYTIFQAWGQIAGAFLLATEQTKMQAKLGIINQFVMITFTFLFQVPNFIWENGLGANGIGLTYLCSVIINVALSLYINSKYLGMKFLSLWKIQIIPLALLSAMMCLLRIIIDNLILGNSLIHNIVKTMFSGTIYTLVCIIVLFNFPQMISVENNSFIIKIKERLIKK